MKAGDIYGFLEVKEVVQVEIDGKIFRTNAVKCKCLRCGCITIVRIESLLSENTKSCGCLNQDRIKKMRNNLTYVEGTFLENIMSNKVYKNNQIGIRGISLKLVKGKYLMYKAKITCSGKTYEKCFKDLYSAIEQRKRWEEELFQPIIEKYSIAQ